MKTISMNCVRCGQLLSTEVAVHNTNIAFLKLTTEPLYQNDDRLLWVCLRENCDFYGLVQLGKDIEPEPEEKCEHKWIEAINGDVFCFKCTKEKGNF